MADAKITALTELTTPVEEDLLAIVDDVAGTPITKKITLSNFISAFNKNSLFNNAIINGNMDVWQRGTSFTAATTPANNDDTFLCDRWNLISDGNDIVDVSRSTDAPDGSTYSMKFLVATANKKFGMVYLMENVDALKLDDKSVSVSFQAKTTTSAVIENLRCAVLSWSSTADTVTSDVVSAWAIEGTNPTWATNWTAENTASNLAITTSWAKYSVENISIDTASMANLAVVIWVDDTDAAANDELYISQVQLNEGAVALPFQPKSFNDELNSCMRYYQKSYDVGTAPGAATQTSIVSFFSTDNDNQKYITESHHYSTPLRKTGPTITLYDAAGNSGKISTLNAAGTKTDNVSPSVGIQGNGMKGHYLTHQISGAGIRYHYTADAEL